MAHITLIRRRLGSVLTLLFLTASSGLYALDPNSRSKSGLPSGNSGRMTRAQARAAGITVGDDSGLPHSSRRRRVTRVQESTTHTTNDGSTGGGSTLPSAYSGRMTRSQARAAGITVGDSDLPHSSRRRRVTRVQEPTTHTTSDGSTGGGSALPSAYSGRITRSQARAAGITVGDSGLPHSSRRRRVMHAQERTEEIPADASNPTSDSNSCIVRPADQTDVKVIIIDDPTIPSGGSSSRVTRAQERTEESAVDSRDLSNTELHHIHGESVEDDHQKTRFKRSIDSRSGEDEDDDRQSDNSDDEDGCNSPRTPKQRKNKEKVTRIAARSSLIHAFSPTSQQRPLRSTPSPYSRYRAITSLKKSGTLPTKEARVLQRALRSQKASVRQVTARATAHAISKNVGSEAFSRYTQDGNTSSFSQEAQTALTQMRQAINKMPPGQRRGGNVAGSLMLRQGHITSGGTSSSGKRTGQHTGNVKQVFAKNSVTNVRMGRMESRKISTVYPQAWSNEDVCRHISDAYQHPVACNMSASRQLLLGKTLDASGNSIYIEMPLTGSVQTATAYPIIFYIRLDEQGEIIEDDGVPNSITTMLDDTALQDTLKTYDQFQYQSTYYGDYNRLRYYIPAKDAEDKVERVVLDCAGYFNRIGRTRLIKGIYVEVPLTKALSLLPDGENGKDYLKSSIDEHKDAQGEHYDKTTLTCRRQLVFEGEGEGPAE